MVLEKTTLIISNEEINDIMKIVQASEDLNILFKVVTKTIKNEAKEQKGGFLIMLLGTLGATLLGDLLTKKLSGKRTLRAGEGTVRAGEDYLVYARDNLPKAIKNETACIVNLDNYKILAHIGLLCV